MKIFSIFLLIAGTFAILVASCSKTQSAEDLAGTATSGDSATFSKAYERGVAVGKTISTLQPGSREREKAMIEVHGMVSALERNGFHQSASAFARGVESAL